MGVWEIKVYDRNWGLLNMDYKRLDDRQQAELEAERDCAFLGGAHWAIRKIR